MKAEPDFYSLPRDAQIAKEHLSDEGGGPWAFMGPKASIDRFEQGQDGLSERR